MSRSWSSIARGPVAATPLKPVATPLKTKPIPKVTFHAFCEDCGKEADVCRRCQELAVYENGLCGSCFSYNIPSDSMCQGYVDAARSARKIPYKCTHCRTERPWRWENDKEVVSYHYVQGCICHKLSPTNVIRMAARRSVGPKPTDPAQRAAEAWAAYEKEMKFSGDAEEAAILYKSFFKDEVDASAKLQEILAARV